MVDLVRLNIDGEIGIVTIDNPPANALGNEVVAGLAEIFSAIAGKPVRAVVVTSAVPGFFAAGADIRQMASLSEAQFLTYHDAMRDAFQTVSESPFPTVAAIDGVAYGGGLELAMACTMRVAGASARLGLPEVKLGLLPAAFGTQRLPRLVGWGRATDMLLTGRTLKSPEALAVGLIDRIADEGSAHVAARALAEDLARLSLPALRAIRRSVEASRDRPFAEGLEVETEEFIGLLRGGEVGEGLAAFLEKRPPRFRAS